MGDASVTADNTGRLLTAMLQCIQGKKSVACDIPLRCVEANNATFVVKLVIFVHYNLSSNTLLGAPVLRTR